MSEGFPCGNPDCGNVGKAKCNSCSSIYYCGGDCQKNHWKKHKTICKLIGYLFLYYCSSYLVLTIYLIIANHHAQNPDDKKKGILDDETRKVLNDSKRDFVLSFEQGKFEQGMCYITNRFVSIINYIK